MFMKKINTISSQRISRLLGKLLYGHQFCHISFCDAIAIYYDEMVSKIFINTGAKPQVKRLTLKSAGAFRIGFGYRLTKCQAKFGLDIRTWLRFSFL